MSNQKKDALKDYVEVNVRIEKFWEKYPDGRIHTELVTWENEKVVMRADVYKKLGDSVPSSSGWAYEKEGSSFINKTSALENCETSAVGRALAILGFEIKKSIASKEEVENAKLNQNKPDPISQQTVGNLTAAVLKFAKLRDKTDKDVYAVLKIEDITKLTESQGLQFVSQLNEWITKAEQEGK
ncbi:MAG: hypothetical protein ACQET8_23020 [Bacillota bacterium]